MRRRTVALAALLALGFSAFSQSSPSKAGQVKWYSFEEAISLNQSNPKKIFIDIYTSWCSWCRVMDKETFNHPQIAAYLNEHYYPVKLNAESKAPITYMGMVFENKGTGSRSPHDLAAALLQGKMSYPSVAYLDEHSKLLTAVPGFYPPDKLEPILKYFGENHYKTTKWEDYMKTFIGTIE